MKYDDIDLTLQIFSHAYYDSVSLIRYFPQIKGQSLASESKLLLDFKGNKPLAREKVKDLALEALNDEEDLEEFCQGYLIALPSHAARSINEPCEYLCAELARAFPQLVHIRQGLKRVMNVEKSATAAPGERPNYNTHINSIVYAGQRIDPRMKMIMVDDVFTRGAISRACHDILKQATGCKDVRGFFVAKTV